MDILLAIRVVMDPGPSMRIEMGNVGLNYSNRMGIEANGYSHLEVLT